MYVEVLTWKFDGGIEEDHENVSQDIQCPRLDSNRAPSEYESRALPPCQPGKIRVKLSLGLIN
jgi:hypothetical protein